MPIMTILVGQAGHICKKMILTFLKSGQNMTWSLSKIEKGSQDP